MQGMRIFLWQAEGKNTDSYLLQGAKFKALDYIKKARNKEVLIGTLNDIDNLINPENDSHTNYYDKWPDIDKETERFIKGDKL